MNFSALTQYLHEAKARGFTLIEVALAIFILGSASVIIMSLLSTLTRSSYATLHDMTYMQRMQSFYYDMHRKRHPERNKNMQQTDDDLTLQYTITSPEGQSSVGRLTNLLREDVQASWEGSRRPQRLQMYYFWFKPKEEKNEKQSS
jgi:prepilin-type N-terminal cleavage/methylation domain-containing protein